MIRQIIEPKYITICDRCNTEVEPINRIAVHIYGYISDQSKYIDKVYHFHKECADVKILELT